jgi:hypothetical protein
MGVNYVEAPELQSGERAFRPAKNALAYDWALAPVHRAQQKIPCGRSERSTWVPNGTTKNLAQDGSAIFAEPNPGYQPPHTQLSSRTRRILAV